MKLNNNFLKNIKEQLTEYEYNEFVSTLNLPSSHGMILKNTNQEINDILIKRFNLELFYKNNNYSYYKYDKQTLNANNVNPGSDILFHLPIYYIQEPSASSVLKNTKSEENEIILDLCASPGGKSIQILCNMEKINNSYLVSNEYDYNRCKTLSSNIEKMGFSKSIITNNNSSDLKNTFFEFFDKIIIDAPCSGEGMFRKSEDAINQWSLSLTEHCSEIQKKLLLDSYEMLKPNGILIYSTCTYSKCEDEDNVDFILKEKKDLELIHIDKIYHYQGIGEGQFFSIIKKNSSSYNSTQKNKFIIPNKFKIHAEDEKIIKAFQKENLNCDFFNMNDKTIIKNKNQYYLVYNYIDLNKYKNLNVLRFCLLIGENFNGRFIPSHAMSRSYLSENFISTLELNEIDFKKYIEGDILDYSGFKSPYVLLKYLSTPIGIAKYSNNKLKNLYPKGLRKRP